MNEFIEFRVSCLSWLTDTETFDVMIDILSKYLPVIVSSKRFFVFFSPKCPELAME